MRIILSSLLVFFLLSLGTVDAADDWTQQSPVSKPSPRVGHDMAYISEDQVLLFGGTTPGGYDHETWVYDLSADTWTQQSPASNPSARAAHGVAYIGGDQVLLFGGWESPSTNNDETWVYDLSDNTWTQQSPVSKPSPRGGHGMAYIGGDQVLLFGGYSGSWHDETWIYDLSDNTWIHQSLVSEPSPRNEPGMARIGGDQVLLFGGHGGHYSDETWIYDVGDNTWTQRSPASKPSARVNSRGMAYIGGDQVVLFGGEDLVPSLDDETWVYDLSDNIWTQDSNTTQPSARVIHSLSETSMDGSSYPVLFGGWDGARDDETWTFGGGDYLLDVVQATIDIEPDVLNLKSHGRWITCYIELPNEYSVEDISTATVALIAVDGEPIDPIYSGRPTGVGDHDDDGIPDLMVKFDRQELIDALIGMIDPPAEVELSVGGELTDGTVFEGSDMIRVIRPGGGPKVLGQENLPGAVVFHGNSPNPLKSETQIRYTVPEGSHVTLRVYDLTGALVRTLVNEHKLAGTFSSQWDGRDAEEKEVASGVYYLRIEAGNSASTKRIVLTR